MLLELVQPIERRRCDLLGRSSAARCAASRLRTAGSTCSGPIASNSGRRRPRDQRVAVRVSARSLMRGAAPSAMGRPAQSSRLRRRRATTCTVPHANRRAVGGEVRNVRSDRPRRRQRRARRARSARRNTARGSPCSSRAGSAAHASMSAACRRKSCGTRPSSRARSSMRGTMGSTSPSRGHDWAALKRGRDAYVQRLNGIYQRNLDRKAIVTIRSAARFAGPSEIVDANGDAYAAEHIVIATGGYPIVPPLPGAELGITSDGFFELERLPAASRDRRQRLRRRRVRRRVQRARRGDGAVRARRAIAARVRFAARRAAREADARGRHRDRDPGLPRAARGAPGDIEARDAGRARNSRGSRR